MITLPESPLPAILDLTGNNLLFVGDYGIGKSGLLASTGYLLADPEDKLKSYPCLRVTLPDWAAHIDFRDAIIKKPAGTFKGIGLDSLNISYNHCMIHVMKTIKFNGVYLAHPAENPQMCYPRITHEFATWLQSMTLLGYHVIATCHANVVEIRGKTGSTYNRWIPGFVGGGQESTYGRVLKVFSVIGFMTLEEVEKPSTAVKMGKSVPDVRADATRIVEQKRVIHFDQSPHWLANNKFSGFPDKVILTSDWKDDWRILQEAWGREEHHEVAAEAITTDLPTVTQGTAAAGLS